MSAEKQKLFQKYGLSVAEIRDIHKMFDVCNETVLQKLQEQLEKEVPIAYILGNQPFRNHLFKVNEHVLIPREDSNCLVEESLKIMSLFENLNILELGTGSGCLIISIVDELLHQKNKKINISATATDISLKALDVAQQNRQNILPQFPINFIQGNWGKNWMWQSQKLINFSAKFDVIFSNPPYIAKNDDHLQHQSLKHEPLQALTDYSDDGLSAIYQILQDIQNFEYLNPNGFVLFEHGWKQGLAVQKLLLDFGYNPQSIKTIKDSMGNNRVTLGQKN